MAAFGVQSASETCRSYSCSLPQKENSLSTEQQPTQQQQMQKLEILVLAWTKRLFSLEELGVDNLACLGLLVKLASIGISDLVRIHGCRLSIPSSEFWNQSV
jgi:hypothetical protein